MINQFNDHSANERTFLSWVRTAMALVGFGLAIAHFRDEAIDVVSQAMLVAMGGLVVLIALIRMHAFMRMIERPQTYSYSAGIHGVLYASSVVLLIGLMLLFIRHVA